jgi:DNA-directed RNA polymerase specialized sigma24 family protein
MAMPERKDARREELLTDPEILSAVRAVLALRGVPRQDIEDLLQQVLTEAWASPKLPLHDREETRLYLCGMARFKAIDDAHERAKHPESIDWLPESDRVAQAVPIEDRELAHTLLEKLAEKYPRTLSWFVRSEVHAEGFAEIAQGANLSPGYVRHEVSEIRRSARQMAMTMGIALAVLLAILFGVRRWRMAHQPDPLALPEPPETAPMLARDLRLRARKECEAEAWQSCADDLDKAHDLDAAGESDEYRDLRGLAHGQVIKSLPPPPPVQQPHDKPPMP